MLALLACDAGEVFSGGSAEIHTWKVRRYTSRNKGTDVGMSLIYSVTR